MTSDEIYTPLEEAREEIHRRWADRELRRKVEEFLGGVPPGVGDEPRAFLCRTVHTPNREFHRYMELASAAGLDPAPMEYLDDRYCNLNPDKLGLVRMTFSRGRNCNGDEVFQRRMIASGEIHGFPFATIRTIWGEDLTLFHQRILRTVFPAIASMNESCWIHSHGSTPRDYYPALLARSLCHGLMFESYLGIPSEAAFNRDVVLPAFEQVCSIFGMKPLVLRLLPEETADNSSWSWYDGEIERLVTGELDKIAKARRSR